MKELVTTLVRGLVRQPERVQVYKEDEDGQTYYDVEVEPSDRGRVIGREGRTVNALRTLLGAVARKRGESCELEIID